MKHYALNLKTVSPLAIRADHAREGSEALSYISGTTLAGGLAALYRLLYAEDHDGFERLFLSGQIQYPDLYPAMFKREEEIQNEIKQPIYPLPMTAQSCKRFQGFIPSSGEIRDEDDEENERHGVRDSLLDWAFFALADREEQASPDLLLQPFQGYKESHKKPGSSELCYHPLDHLSGYYRRHSDPDKMALVSSENTRLQTHTGISRETGTVQEGILYNRRVFDENTSFWGMVKLPEGLDSAFKQFIKEVGPTGLVRIGTGRTRGMGKVHIGIKPMADPQEQFSAFQQRLHAFDSQLRQTVKNLEGAAKLSPGLKPFHFALTLHSAVILRDEQLRYRGAIDADALKKLLSLSEQKFTLLYQAARTRRISGWNDMWGTPRTNEIAIETGSVFLFESNLPQAELEENLFRLENEGIGQRRAEGFGRICVSDPFHREVKLR